QPATARLTLTHDPRPVLGQIQPPIHSHPVHSSLPPVRQGHQPTDSHVTTTLPPAVDVPPVLLIVSAAVIVNSLVRSTMSSTATPAPSANSTLTSRSVALTPVTVMSP